MIPSIFKPRAIGGMVYPSYWDLLLMWLGVKPSITFVQNPMTVTCPIQFANVQDPDKVYTHDCYEWKEGDVVYRVETRDSAVGPYVTERMYTNEDRENHWNSRLIEHTYHLRSNALKAVIDYYERRAEETEYKLATLKQQREAQILAERE